MKEKIFNYIKTISLWILIISFITSTAGFFTNISDYLLQANINKYPTNKDLKDYAINLEENINDLTSDLKDNLGEDYPALGVVYYKTILHYSSERFVQSFLFELIAGFALGNIIYFIFIAKCKKYKLFIALIIILFISALFFELTDILTNYVNGENFKLSFKNILFTMEVIGIPYSIISILLVAINNIYKTYIEIRYS